MSTNEIFQLQADMDQAIEMGMSIKESQQKAKLMNRQLGTLGEIIRVFTCTPSRMHSPAFPNN